MKYLKGECGVGKALTRTGISAPFRGIFKQKLYDNLEITRGEVRMFSMTANVPFCHVKPPLNQGGCFQQALKRKKNRMNLEMKVLESGTRVERHRIP